VKSTLPLTMAKQAELSYCDTDHNRMTQGIVYTMLGSV